MTLVDANDSKEDDIENIKVKMADIENRSRRNNIKIKGVSESVKPQDLRKYSFQMFSAILPDMTELDYTVDRIHRLPKPSYLADDIPRDVILQLHLYHKKREVDGSIQAERPNTSNICKSSVLCGFISIHPTKA